MEEESAGSGIWESIQENANRRQFVNDIEARWLWGTDPYQQRRMEEVPVFDNNQSMVDRMQSEQILYNAAMNQLNNYVRQNPVTPNQAFNVEQIADPVLLQELRDYRPPERNITITTNAEDVRMFEEAMREQARAQYPLTPGEALMPGQMGIMPDVGVAVNAHAAMPPGQVLVTGTAGELDNNQDLQQMFYNSPDRNHLEQPMNYMMGYDPYR